MEAGSLRSANQVPFVRLVVKEEEVEEAREEVREKRRAACVSLGAGSIAGEEGSGREKRNGEKPGRKQSDRRERVKK